MLRGHPFMTSMPRGEGRLRSRNVDKARDVAQIYSQVNLPSAEKGEGIKTPKIFADVLDGLPITAMTTTIVMINRNFEWQSK